MNCVLRISTENQNDNDFNNFTFSGDNYIRNRNIIIQAYRTKMNEEAIRELVQIKWSLVCIAVSMWGLSLYFLLKEAPKWWKSFDKEGEKTIGFKFKDKKNE